MRCCRPFGSPGPRRFDRIFLAGLVWIALVSTGCSDRGEPPADAASSSLAGVELELSRAPEWVAFYDPRRASSGYNLALFRRRLPVLFDMNGRVVHSWPGVRAKSRVRLLPDGSLLSLDLDKTVSRWSWSGELLAHWPLPGRIPHHDIFWTRAGNLMVVARAEGEATDDLLEIDGSGATVWEWSSRESLAPYFDRWFGGDGSRSNFANPDQERDLTHVNSVQELPENRHFDTGDDRFRPGNLLISARNLNSIFVIDRESGEVTWDYSSRLDYQHEALMIEPGQPGAGNILLFNNGYHDRYRYRSSEIVEIDPATSERTWEYSSPTFYSSTAGVEQPLPNGNVLVSSSQGGRVFELTRGGDLVLAVDTAVRAAPSPPGAVRLHPAAGGARAPRGADRTPAAWLSLRRPGRLPHRPTERAAARPPGRCSDQGADGPESLSPGLPARSLRPEARLRNRPEADAPGRPSEGPGDLSGLGRGWGGGARDREPLAAQAAPIGGGEAQGSTST